MPEALTAIASASRGPLWCTVLRFFTPSAFEEPLPYFEEPFVCLTQGVKPREAGEHRVWASDEQVPDRQAPSVGSSAMTHSTEPISPFALSAVFHELSFNSTSTYLWQQGIHSLSAGLLCP